MLRKLKFIKYFDAKIGIKVKNQILGRILDETNRRWYVSSCSNWTSIWRSHSYRLELDPIESDCRLERNITNWKLYSKSKSTLVKNIIAAKRNLVVWDRATPFIYRDNSYFETLVFYDESSSYLLKIRKLTRITRSNRWRMLFKTTIWVLKPFLNTLRVSKFVYDDRVARQTLRFCAASRNQQKRYDATRQRWKSVGTWVNIDKHWR